MTENYTQEDRDRALQSAKQLLLNSGYFGNLNFHTEDIQEKYLRDFVTNEPLTEEELGEISTIADDIIRSNETIWEGYWFSIDEAINEFLDKKYSE